MPGCSARVNRKIAAISLTKPIWLAWLFSKFASPFVDELSTVHAVTVRLAYQFLLRFIAFYTFQLWICSGCSITQRPPEAPLGLFRQFRDVFPTINRWNL